MAYIGPEPNPGQNREVDDISSGFNGSTTAFTLQVNSQNVSPGSSNAIIVSLGGVIQNPGTDYTIAASTITFTTAPASGLSFFGLVLGQQVDTEGTADGSITLSKFVNGTASNNGKFLRANNGAAPSFETVSAGTSLSGSTNNTVTTVTGADAIQGEANLTFDGTTLTVTGSNEADMLHFTTGNTAGNTFAGIRGDNESGIKIRGGGSFDGGTIELGGGLRDTNPGIITFSTGTGVTPSEVMRIAADGNIGVGDSATSPAHDIHIRNNKFADLKIENIANGGEAAFNLAGKTSGGVVRMLMLKYDSNDSFRMGSQANINLGFETSDQTRLTIDGSGNIGAPSGTNIYNASDERLKKNVVTLDKGLTAINSLRPVSFNWIDGFCDSEKETLYGFIAQEVKTVDTNLISQFGLDGTVEVGETKIEDTLRVNEKFITPVLVKAVQELSAKVTTLETEKTKLQTDLTALTARVAALETA